jgi:hypothetical protein
MNAQVTKESYEKSIDFLNCKSVELSLQSMPGGEQVKFTTACKCSTADYGQIYKTLTNISGVKNSLSKTIILSKEIESLKSKYDSSVTKENVIKYLTDDIFKNSNYQSIGSFYNKRKNSTVVINTLKQELSDYFIQNLEEVKRTVIQNSPVTETNDTDQYSEESLEQASVTLESEVNTNLFLENSENIYFVLAISLIISSIISLLFSIYNKKQTKEEILQRIKKELSKIESTNTFSSHSNSNLHTDELRRLQNKIAEVEKKLLSLDQVLINNKSSNNQSEAVLLYSKQNVDTISETFFLSAPNIDGTFDKSSSSSTYRPGATIYKFTSLGNNKAKFRISEVDASIKLALQYQDKTIDPVCDNLNAYDPQSTKIVTVSEGEAELQGEKWVCNIKAKIRYEN